LPRVTSYYNYNAHRYEQLFPLVVSDSEGLVIDFSLLRASRGARRCVPVLRPARFDLTAISRLDEVRTAELKQSLDFLKPQSPSHGL